MHTAPDLLEAQNDDLARYLDLHAGVSHLLPAPEAQGRRDVFAVPHLDAEAVRRAILTDRADRIAARVSSAIGAIAGIVFLGAAAQVVALFVGGVL